MPGKSRVFVLAHDDVIMYDLAAPVHVFGHRASGFYEVSLLAEASSVRTSTGIHLQAVRTLRDTFANEIDLLFVPGFSGAGMTSPRPGSVTFVADAWKSGVTIVSICTGAFILAEAGLLDGKEATTHWAVAELLQNSYPSVRVQGDKLYTEADRLFTSAGSSAAYDLCLAILTRRHGAAFANEVARLMVYPPMRSGDQVQFIDYRLPITLAGGGVSKLMAWRLDRIDQNVSLVSRVVKALRVG